MRNTLPLMALLIGGAGLCHAASINPEKALARLHDSATPYITPATRGGAPLELQMTVGDLYVFSSGEGFVVLPADDSAAPLLAYSDRGAFSAEGNPALEYWLDYYNREIEYLKASGAPVWRPTRSSGEEHAPISPLIKTEWNQESPYNEKCPKVNGHEVVTGCVATAMAQAMKFFNYPQHGKGTHSYYWEPGKQELSFDYAKTDFKWNLMTDTYDSKSTQASRDAVAELMVACGISVDMHYDVGESGAATRQMGMALIDIFDYSPSLWMPSRAYYGYDEWETMIYGNLAEGLPVLYSGAGTAGGHQFIVDGYSSDGFFHLNWGWGGLSNGYYLLTALNPDDLGVGGGAGGFNSSQTATLNMRPPKPGDRRVYIMYNTEGFTTEVGSVKEGDAFVGHGQYFNFGMSDLPEGSHLGMRFVSKDAGVDRYVEGPGVGGYHPNDGRNNMEIKFPSLPDGTYTITPALYADGEWTEVRMSVGQPQEITAVVSGGVAILSDQQQASVVVSGIQVPEVVYRDHPFPMPFTVTNVSDNEYYSTVTPVLVDQYGDVVSVSVFRPVDVLPGETVDISDYAATFKPVKDGELPAGEYALIFLDGEEREISEPITVNLEIMSADTKIKLSDFRMVTANPVSDSKAVDFSFKVDCESGAFYDYLNLRVFPGDGGYEVYSVQSERFYLTGGESVTVPLTADFSGLKDGDYMCAMYKANTILTDIINFRIETKESGVKEITMERGDASIYDLNGVRHTGQLSPGIYIIDGRKVLVR